MKIKVMAIVDRYEEGLSDHEKVFVAFLTHLHRTYEDVKSFRLYTRDVKAILRIHVNSKMPASYGPFRIARLTNMLQYWSLVYSDYDTKDNVEWEITDQRAIATHTYLQTLIATEDLADRRPEKKISEYRETETNAYTYNQGVRFTRQEIDDIFDFEI